MNPETCEDAQGSEHNLANKGAKYSLSDELVLNSHMNNSVTDNKNEASQHQLERLLFQSLILSSCDPAHSSENDEEEEKNELNLTDDLSSPDAQLAIYLAASFFEYSDSLFACCDSWTDLSDWHEPTLTWLRESDEDAAARIEDHPQALDALSEGLFALFSLPATSSTNARFAVGDYVLAVLKQDLEWHEAIVEDIQEDNNNGAITYHVRFTEYGAPQTVSDEDIAFDSNVDEELDTENACRVCRRVMPLTFHHLIPRETHSHVLKKGGTLLITVIESLYANRCEKYRSKSRKDWLEVHGIKICRKCHSQIHRVESNMSLALKFNTLESIMQHPQIIKWRAWASRQ